MTRSVVLTLIDMVILVVVSISLGAFLSPADPYSFLMFSLVLLLVTVGSYGVGFRRGTKRT